MISRTLVSRKRKQRSRSLKALHMTLAKKRFGEGTVTWLAGAERLKVGAIPTGSSCWTLP